MNVILIASDLADIAAEAQLSVGQIHSVFDHAVNCTFKESGWMTILTEEAAIGPMGLVVKAQNLKSLTLVPGMKLELGRNRIVVSEAGLVLQTKGVPLWNPLPEVLKDPVGLTEKRERLEKLEKWIRKNGNLAGIANVLEYLELPDRSRKLRPDTELNAFGQFALERIQAFSEVVAEPDMERVRERARGIIGFGPGLTPSGDDFLAGVGASLIYLSAYYRLKKKTGMGMLKAISEEACGRTTRVSEEMLRHLAAGRMSKRVMDLQQSLLSQNGPEIGATLTEIGKMGETSGTDLALGVFVAHSVLASEEARRKLG